MKNNVVKKLNKKKVGIAIAMFIVLILLICISILGFNLSAATDKNESEKFIIDEGTASYTVIDNLEKEKLIKNAFAFKVYMKIFGDLEFKAGTYYVNGSQNSIKIYNNFKNNSFPVPDAELITFKEGLNMNDIIDIICKHSNHSEKEVKEKLEDEAYLDSLIKKYSFITKEIKNEKLYYSLEGYLFPDTYSIEKDATLEVIFGMMLDRMQVELNKYTDEINKSKYSVHELLTLASIVELEGKNLSDREKIAGVFYNRLNDGMDLGSCVTTYYAVGKVMGKDELYNSDISKVNPYNTRASGMAGKLPVGPISNPGAESIKVVMQPKETKYYYFLNDTSGKLYFSVTIDEHDNKISKLTKEGKF